MQQIQGGYGVSQGQQCMDQIGTCERDICECDLAFVTGKRFVERLKRSGFPEYDVRIDIETINLEFVNNKIDYDVTSDHDLGFNFDSECVQRGRNTNSLGCCRSYSMETAFVIYRVDRQECCRDGTVASVGEC